MSKLLFYIVIGLLSSCLYTAHSQNCTVPLPPVLTSVSVQPETGQTDFKWTLSPSTDIAAYIIYSYKNGDGLPIDTIWDPNATSYTLNSTATKYFSVSYVVTAHRLSAVPGEPGCTSPLSNFLSTIFCTTVLDTCNKKLTVQWNKYADVPKHVKEYRILVSVNGGVLTGMYTVKNDADNFIISDFATDSQYCIAVKAVFEDGTGSTSNKSCLSTRMQRPPQWINADYSSIDADNNTELSFTVDPASEINHFMLERRSGSVGSYQVLANPVSENGVVKFTDDKADINTVYNYRLSAINSCNIPVTVSNISSNIVLSLKTAGEDLTLSWNKYKEWSGTVSSYRLFINTGRGYEEKAVFQASDSVIKLAYKDIMFEVSGNEVCFYIEASEISNPHGVTGHSQSSKVCTAPTELITVPNVFTPDNDLLNDFFRPVLSFTPRDYHLIISSRKGDILFETRDFNSQWDGSHNGTPEPEGVYLWFLKVTTPSGKGITRTGTLTIVHNR